MNPDNNKNHPINRSVLNLAGLTFLVALTGCGGSSNSDDNTTDFDWRLPQGFPTPSGEEKLVMTDELVELGRFLFYDRRMSINETTSCGTCHQPSLGFTDGLEVSVGAFGDKHLRNAPTMTNVVYNASQNWANPATLTLHAQAMGPLFGETPIVELGWSDNEDTIIARFKNDTDYQNRFTSAFPDAEDPFIADHFVQATAAFGATLISGNAPIDKFVYQNQSDAISDSAKRGQDLFFSERLECFHCHGGFNFASAVDHEGLEFEQIEFHNNGLYNVGGTGAYPAGNQGLFDITHENEDRGKFKAPTLRNIALTAPYMHDGSIGTLEEVIDMYARGGRLIEEGPHAGDGALNPHRSELLTGFLLTDQERQDLMAFLESLTDWEFICEERFSDPFGEFQLHEQCATQGS